MKLPKAISDWIEMMYGKESDMDSDQLCRLVGLQDMAQEILTHPTKYGLVKMEDCQGLVDSCKLISLLEKQSHNPNERPFVDEWAKAFYKCIDAVEDWEKLKQEGE